MKELMVRRKRWLWVIAAGGLVIGLVVAVWWWLSAPAVGHLKTPSGKTAASLESTKSSTVVGESANFKLPPDYKPNAAPKNPAAPESYRYAESKPNGALITVSIKPWSLAATADSSYQYRHLHPELYTEKTVTVAGVEAAEMIAKDDGYGAVVWVAGGGKLAIISLTAGSNDPDYNQQLAELLKSWEWK